MDAEKEHLEQVERLDAQKAARKRKQEEKLKARRKADAEKRAVEAQAVSAALGKENEVAVMTSEIQEMQSVSAAAPRPAPLGTPASSLPVSRESSRPNSKQSHSRDQFRRIRPHTTDGQRPAREPQPVRPQSQQQFRSNKKKPTGPVKELIHDIRRRADKASPTVTVSRNSHDGSIQLQAQYRGAGIATRNTRHEVYGAVSTGAAHADALGTEFRAITGIKDPAERQGRPKSASKRTPSRPTSAFMVPPALLPHPDMQRRLPSVGWGSVDPEPAPVAVSADTWNVVEDTDHEIVAEEAGAHLTLRSAVSRLGHSLPQVEA
eukprot:NODE_2366_length_1080_cov_33.181532_g2348_i0.p1 GENE.NODE_2366_length_1080_cov_33.181532_g2348_i0~~NODE_2366_length_1080_cov_33.181532_g2348_i0.p1  ORF type:complete len:347 (+),score=68.43 NODE_2366_length_1080_cov_33.181532_g2348_i0:84-1043(+)